MLKILGIAIFACSLSVLNGCSVVSKHSHNTVFWYQSTEALIEAKQFKKALEQIRAEQPNNKKRLANTQKQARIYRQKQTKLIKSLIEQRQWGKAKNLILQLEQSQPAHKIWETLTQTLKAARTQEKRLLDTEQALLEAQLLATKTKQADFNSRSNTYLIHWLQQDSTFTQKKLDLAETLLQLSTAAIKQQDYENAQATYKKAIELNKELRTGNLTQLIHKGLSENNRKAIFKRQKRLLKQLKLAIKEQDFESIIHHQRILSNAPFTGKKVTQSLKQAQALREIAAKAKNKQGDQIYRQGHIEQAIELWQQARWLNPALAEIDAKLKRSIKVKKKLERLSRHDEI